MILTIDKASAEPLYLQLRTQIIAAIARGELQPGDPLPSVRSLGTDLGVNLHTVNKAYAVLRDEGYVAMFGRNGTVVADRQQDGSPEQDRKNDARTLAAMEALAAEYLASGGTPEGFAALAAQAVGATGTAATHMAGTAGTTAVQAMPVSSK